MLFLEKGVCLVGGGQALTAEPFLPVHVLSGGCCTFSLTPNVQLYPVGGWCEGCLPSLMEEACQVWLLHYVLDTASTRLLSRLKVLASCLRAGTWQKQKHGQEGL